MRWYKSNRVVQVIVLVLMWAGAMLPLIWTLVRSFESETAFRLDNLFLWIAKYCSLDQYKKTMFYDLEYWYSYCNTIWLTVPTVILAVGIDAVAAYGLTVMRGKSQNKLMLVYALLALIPAQVLLVPHLLVLNGLHLTGTRMAVILVGCFSPWYLFFLYRICRRIPDEVFEMARVEGAGEWTIFQKIALPQMLPGLLIFVIIVSADLWGMVEEPLVYIQESSKYPLSIFFKDRETALPFAGIVVLVMPIVLMFVEMLCTLANRQEEKR